MSPKGRMCEATVRMHFFFSITEIQFVTSSYEKFFLCLESRKGNNNIRQANDIKYGAESQGKRDKTQRKKRKPCDPTDLSVAIIRTP